jgi:hypothetical protein
LTWTAITHSWNDGLALCALIHRHRPELLDFHALNPKNKLENARLAMDVAERDIGIPVGLLLLL